MLRRFWFPVPGHSGIGVTAFSLGDAEALARSVADELDWHFSASEVLEDVDVRILDQRHVIPNMSSPHTRGIWYPPT